MLRKCFIQHLHHANCKHSIETHTQMHNNTARQKSHSNRAPPTQANAAALERSSSGRNAAVPPHEVFGLRERLAVATGENCVSIAHVVDVDVPARNHSALLAARRGGKQLRGGAAYAPCKCRDSPLGQSNAQRPCTMRRLLKIRTSP